MNIVITCPRYFSEIKNLDSLLSKQDANIDYIEPLGQGFSLNEMKSNLQNASIAVVGDDQIDDSILEECKNLELIIKWGAGIDNINIKGTKPKILNSPGDIYLDVAEHTVFLIGALLKNIPSIHNQILLNNIWAKPVGTRIMNKNVGFIGFGRIGQQTAKILTSFGANIYFSDPFIQNLENNLGEKKEIEYLKEKCDILIITASLTDDTRNLLNNNFFNSLGKKPYIVNVSRGAIINEKDLIIALEKDLISGCALDVFEKEPLESLSEIRKSNKVVYSSHNASNTFEANKSVNSQVTNLILEWLNE
jgi:phosphoglycerate dehydrogenase-like enzyme|tara:strand:+ start:26712 stop:27629 length:918 start_codon:yes stop_codon:yes gene_type:complete